MEQAEQAPESPHPAPVTGPALRRQPPAEGSPARQAFRQAIWEVEHLRERLRELRQEQAGARRRYWHAVGPAAAAVVAARRALFAPLENALLLGYFSQLEETRLAELILANARTLEERFGEDAADIIRKYTAPSRRKADAIPEPKAEAPKPAAAKARDVPGPGPGSGPDRPAHEQAAAAARARRPSKAQRAQQAAEAAARAEAQQLAASTKTLYRQLARAHHPDLERDPEKQAARTAQMQRITAAYEADDLYLLLQLLAESGPADPDADDVLARYARALGQQQISLQQELKALQYGPDSFAASTGKKQELELRQLKRDLRAEAEHVQQVLHRAQAPGGLRELLRERVAL